MATYNKNNASKKSTTTASIISDIRVYPYDGKSNTKAFVNVTLCGAFAINGITIVEGKKGMFVSMPQRLTGKGRNAEYKNICFPVTKEFREELYSKILAEYDATDTEDTDD